MRLRRMADRLYFVFYLSCVLLPICLSQSLDQHLHCNNTTRCSSCECSALRRCGGVLQVREWNFQLPQGMNPMCLDCTWVLSVPGTKRVRLTFPQFVLGRGDYVQVFDGCSTTNPLIVEYNEGDRPVDLVSSGNRITVKFYSDLCGSNSVISGIFRPNDCGGLFYLFPSNKNKKQQTVQSPNYPRPYPSYSDCLWTFVSGENSLLSVNINIDHISTGHPADRVVLHETLRNSQDDVYTFAGYRPVENIRYLVRDVPGITISFSSGEGKRGKRFRLEIVSLLTVSDCSHQGKLENGRVKFTDFGKTAAYSCCNGFKLIGDERISCGKAGWRQSSIPSCTPVDSCMSPKNMEIVDGSRSAPLGSYAKLACIRGYVLSNAAHSISVLCKCNGQWNISSDVPLCENYQCGPPPPSPPPNGKREHNQTNCMYPVGSVVNYTCPNGYSLDGVPYRICSDDLQWKPVTKIHTCKPDFINCPDPGIPKNGIRQILSFGVGSLATFRCKPGYISEGPQLRLCKLKSNGKASWTGKQLVCKSKFESPGELAVQLKNSLVNRSFACINGSTDSTVVNPTYPATSTAIGTINVNNRLLQPVECEGRAVVVGQGCIDLIYIIDCSRNVGVENFNQSLDFAGRSMSLFDIDGGVARVSLITYDDDVYYHFKLGEKKTRAKTVDAIRKVTYCGGATATRKVLRFLKAEVIKTTRPECMRSVFLFSAANNNWATKPIVKVDNLKKEESFVICTIAFRNSYQSINTESLKSIASRPEYFFEVTDVTKLKQSLNDAFHKDVDYCEECGTLPTSELVKTRTGEHGSETRTWPWMVGIYRVIHGSPSFLCGGTLVGDCWVLTAAGCFHYGGYESEDIRVVVGDTNRYIQDFSEETFFVRDTFVHPHFNVDAEYNRDIALLKLSCNATCFPRVRKVCLPVAQDIIYYNTGTNCIVTGWGASKMVELGGDSGPKAITMKELHLPIADKDICIKSTSPQFRRDITNFTVCAGDGTGQNDPCQGDSGGPLFCKRRNQDTYVVVGIVSWGEGCNQPNKYGIFTHVLNLIDWVNDIMMKRKCRNSEDEGQEKRIRPSQLV